MLAAAWFAYLLEVRGASSFSEFIDQICANQPLPPYLMLTIIGGFYIHLFVLYLIGHFKRSALGEFQKRPSSGNWRI
jgi:hypothetical protein